MDPFVPYVLAELRSVELQREAERSRVIAECPRSSVRHHLFPRVRRALGVRLIRAGLRLTLSDR